MIISITGHRPNKLGCEYNHEGLYSDSIKWYFSKVFKELNADTIISGMAIGVDLIAASVCLDLGLKLICAVPFPEQDSRWPKQTKRFYQEILKQGKSICVSERFSKKAFQTRNEWMVNHSDLTIAIWDGTSGGTGNCVEYANKIKHPIIIKTPYSCITDYQEANKIARTM